MKCTEISIRLERAADHDVRRQKAIHGTRHTLHGNCPVREKIHHLPSRVDARVWPFPSYGDLLYGVM